MGRMFASDLAENAKNKLQLRIAVETHLRYNHFPPVPFSMVDPCIRAIEYANRGEFDHHIRLPKYVTWRGKKTAPVWDVVDAHHLDCFIDYIEE